MPYRIELHFDLGSPEEKYTEEWALRVHRILNFSEELFYAFRDSDLASHDVVDQATSRLVISVYSKSKLRRVVTKIEKMIEEHFSDGIAKLTVEHEFPT